VPTSIVPSRFVIGPAVVRYRAVGVNTAWTEVGVTLDDAVMRLPTEWFTPDNLSGVMGPVQGLDVLRSVGVEIEFTLAEIAGEKLALAIPGARYTAPVDTVKSSGHLDTTTTAATVAGATVLPLTAVTNGSVGDTIKIDTGASAEFRRIVAINSLNVTVDWPLAYAHSSGAVVEESDGDNRSLVEMPIVRRQPDSAYREWSLVAESGRSEPVELVIPRGISTTTGAEVTIGDDSLAGIRVTIAGRLNPSDLTASIFRLYAPNPA
jgi:hypothetical protein